MWFCRFRPGLVAAVSVAAVVGLAGSELLGPWWSVLVDDAGQLVAAAGAAVACWATAGRYRGGQRWWRVWMGAGAAGWAAGQVIWSWYQLVRGVGLPAPSLADAGYLTLPVFVIPALAAVSDRSPPGVTRRAVTVLDGLIIVGALFALSWGTVLGSVVRHGSAGPLAFAVAIAYPISDLLLTVIVVMLIAVASSPVNRRQLVLLGCGLFALSLSDSVFAYRVSIGADGMPPATDAGFIAGFALIAVAALTPPGETPEPAVRPEVHWGHLLLPYVPVLAMGAMLVVRCALDVAPDPVVGIAATLVIGLVVIRQAVALVQGANLVASRARLLLATDLARRRLERDLHDGVQQRLISLALDVRRAEADAPPELDGLRRQLADIVDGLNATAEEVRELSRGVHPAILTDGGLRPALRALARRSAVPVDVDVRVEGRLPESLEVAAYYVVAEALTNVAKHADATLVTVSTEVRGPGLYLTVTDDGHGGADPRRGTGLTGLRDRVEALGGTLAVDSCPGVGTRLHAELPLTA
ncbi:sensor histidine kinase [Dactylosporangium matsuzakiense]|uniref:sensor histidine kinase n=1 Tax=Dactylosporangium matsuzakiense TaxID=53360 RepID=UPI0021C456F5|nr:sensor histidine kinase [Dactylosporangium matsuzakiense]UWZ41051.1 sensor histidine kinase [Dactylosporangium matsuzakiense]